MAPGSADINFDEFQAIRRRKAQDDEEDEDQKEEPATPPKAEEDEEPDGLAERAGAFAELPEVQLLLCVAILADVAGAALTAARDDGAPAVLVPGPRRTVMKRISPLVQVQDIFPSSRDET